LANQFAIERREIEADRANASVLVGA